MAEAYKCDRCGKLYEGYDRNLNPIKDHREDYTLKVMRKGRYSNAHDKCFDLCPKCYKEFADFVLLKVESEEDKPHYTAESEDVVVANKNLCDSCTTKNCIFQSGIVRNHCDFYKAESEEEE